VRSVGQQEHFNSSTEADLGFYVPEEKQLRFSLKKIIVLVNINTKEENMGYGSYIIPSQEIILFKFP